MLQPDIDKRINKKNVFICKWYFFMSQKEGKAKSALGANLLAR